jgi:hypothetical protein
VTTSKQPVQFTAKQLDELEKTFPQMTLPHTASEAHMREYFGQQSVMEFVRKRVQRDSFPR